MDPVSFMTKEISQLTKAGVPYKDRLFVGDVHIVCPHHKLLDLMGSVRHGRLELAIFRSVWQLLRVGTFFCAS